MRVINDFSPISTHSARKTLSTVLVYTRKNYADSESAQIVLTLFSSFDRCEDGRTVYLKDDFWGGLNKRGDLVTYFCPFQYCNCTSTRALPGCLFDSNIIDRQCAENREGWLCECQGDSSVGLR